MDRKKIILFILIILIILFLCNVIYARYVLSKKVNAKITSAAFNFDVSVSANKIIYNETTGQAELDLNIKNNDGTIFNVFDTNYEISILNNDKIKTTIDGAEVVDNISARVLSGNSLKDEILKLIFSPKDISEGINIVENLEIKIVSNSPYKKEYNIPITILTLKEWNYDYTGAIQTFTAPAAGIYKLEVWGAQGGSPSTTYIGGYGGYSVGNAQLVEDEKIYIGVGEQGKSGYPTQNILGGYNGGGIVYKWSSDPDETNRTVAGGGGATHMALSDGILSTLSADVNSILIVAGGGGGGYRHDSTGYQANGGHAGGMQGKNGAYGKYGGYYGLGGTQTKAGTALTYTNYGVGAFGLGGSVTTCSHGSAGGGGFYGGGASYGYPLNSTVGPNCNSSGGGGSGYIGNSRLIDKYMAGYSAVTSTDANTKTNSVSNATSVATKDCAKIGNGYAKITFVGI